MLDFISSFIDGKFLVQLGVLAASGFAMYWFLWRPVTQRKETYHEFFKALEDVNATPWFKFRMLFKGLKVELWSNFWIIAPLIISALQMVESIPQFFYLSFLPEPVQAAAPAFISAISMVTAYLNRQRSTPVGSPVPEAPTAIDVPTNAGSPDVVITASASGGVHNVTPVGEVSAADYLPPAELVIDEPDVSEKAGDRAPTKVKKKRTVSNRKKKKAKKKKKGRR